MLNEWASAVLLFAWGLCERTMCKMKNGTSFIQIRLFVDVRNESHSIELVVIEAYFMMLNTVNGWPWIVQWHSFGQCWYSYSLKTNFRQTLNIKTGFIGVPSTHIQKHQPTKLQQKVLAIELYNPYLSCSQYEGAYQTFITFELYACWMWCHSSSIRNGFLSL